MIILPGGGEYRLTTQLNVRHAPKMVTTFLQDYQWILEVPFITLTPKTNNQARKFIFPTAFLSTSSDLLVFPALLPSYAKAYKNERARRYKCSRTKNTVFRNTLGYSLFIMSRIPATNYYYTRRGLQCSSSCLPASHINV